MTASRIDESGIASSRSNGHVALPYLTAGAGWADYGTAQDSEEMFEYIKGYSPVHNVKGNSLSSYYGLPREITMIE
jgi:hypothetical protein